MRGSEPQVADFNLQIKTLLGSQTRGSFKDVDNEDDDYETTRIIPLKSST